MCHQAKIARDPEAEIDALMQTFRQLGYLGRFSEARAAAEEAALIAERHELPILRAEIDAAVASLQGVHGELALACQGLSDAFTRLERAGARPNVALPLDYGAFQCMRGHGTEVTDMLELAQAEARKLGGALQVGIASFWSALAHAYRGLFTSAFATVAEAIRLAERNDDVFVLPRLLSLAAWLRRELGDPEAALAWDRRALESASSGVLSDNRAHPLVGLALDQLALGRPDRADEALREVEDLLEHSFFDDWLVRVRYQGAKTRRALQLGDIEEAAAAATRLAALAERHDLGKHRARAHLLMAEVHLRTGAWPACARELDALAARLARTPLVLIAWRQFALRARLADAEGDAGAAQAARAQGSSAVAEILRTSPLAFRENFSALVRASGLEAALPQG